MTDTESNIEVALEVHYERPDFFQYTNKLDCFQPFYGLIYHIASIRVRDAVDFRDLTYEIAPVLHSLLCGHKVLNSHVDSLRVSDP